MCIVPAAAIAANVLDFFADVTVYHKRHVVVVVMMRVALFFLGVERHHFNQVKRLLLRFLHSHGRILPVCCGQPTPMHDGGRGVRHWVTGRLEH